MNTLSYKTISVNKETAKKEWVVIDATDQVVGRLCSKVAKLVCLLDALTLQDAGAESTGEAIACTYGISHLNLWSLLE